MRALAPRHPSVVANTAYKCGGLTSCRATIDSRTIDMFGTVGIALCAINLVIVDCLTAPKISGTK
jgi:hypothetical protein